MDRRGSGQVRQISTKPFGKCRPIALAVLSSLILLAYPDVSAADGICGHVKFFEKGKEEFILTIPDGAETLDIETEGKEVTFTDVYTSPPELIKKDGYTLIGKPSNARAILTVAKAGDVILEHGGKLYRNHVTANRAWNVVLPSDKPIAVKLHEGTKPGKASGSAPHYEVKIPENSKVSVPVSGGRRLHVRLAQGEWLTETADSAKRGELSAPEQFRVARGAKLQLTLHKPGFRFANKPVQVCYEGRETERYVYIPNVVLKSPTVDQVSVLVSMPREMDIADLATSDFPWLTGKRVGLRVVQLAEDGTINLAAETEIRVSSVGVAVLLAIAAFAVAYLSPWLFYVRRNDSDDGKPKPGFTLLTLVSGKTGRASLSTFQIWLWTIIVFTTSAYVWCLSGELIEITNGILVLLGISGTASLAARITAIKKAERGMAVLALENAEMKKKDKPEWKDLISAGGEFNLYKFQMFLFTLLAAGFVVFTVFSELRFPELPANLLLLMGISNGVYLGGKISASNPFEKLESIYREMQAAEARLSQKKKELENLEAELQGMSGKDKADARKSHEAEIERLKGEIAALEAEVQKLTQQYGDARSAVDSIVQNRPAPAS